MSAKRSLGKHDRLANAPEELDLPPESLRRKEQEVPNEANGLAAALLQLTGTVNRVLSKVEGQEKRIIGREAQVQLSIELFRGVHS